MPRTPDFEALAARAALKHEQADQLEEGLRALGGTRKGRAAMREILVYAYKAEAGREGQLDRMRKMPAKEIEEEVRGMARAARTEGDALLEKAREALPAWLAKGKSNWGRLSPAQQRACLRGLAVAGRIAGADRARLLDAVRATKFEQRMPGHLGQHLALKGKPLFTAITPAAKIARNQEKLEAVAAHEAVHALGLPDALASATQAFLNLQTPGYPRWKRADWRKKKARHYSAEQISQAKELKEDGLNEATYTQGFHLGLRAHALAERGGSRSYGLAFLKLLAQGSGSREAEQKVLAEIKAASSRP